jgi:TP901 family phage tail tape measure protein
MASRGNRFSLSAVIGLKNRFSKPLKKMGGAYNRFARNIRDKNHMIGKSFRKMNRGMNRAMKVGAIAGVTALTIGLGLAAREFVNFDQSIVNATAKFKDLERGTANYDQTMVKLKKTAREVAGVTEFTAADSARALDFFAKAGFTSVEAMGSLKDEIDLATVSAMDFNRTADISSDLLGSFGLNVENSAQKVKNLAKLNRALGIGTNLANVTLEDLFESLKTGAPIATDLGVPMHELVAIVAALGSAGIKGSLAATTLKNAYGRLISPTQKVQGALDSLGITQRDMLKADGSFDLIKLMSKIGKATKDMSKVKRSKALFDIFGLRAVAGASNIAKSLGQIQGIMDKLEGADKLSDIAEEIRKGLGVKFKILQSAAMEKAFQFFEAFESAGKSGLDRLIAAVRAFDVKPVVEFTRTIGKFLGFIADNWKIILAFAGAIKGASIAMGVLSFATGVLGITLAATPIGWIIGIIAALIAIMILLATHFDDVVQFIQKWWKVLLFTPIGPFILSLMAIVSILDKLGVTLDGTIDFFKTMWKWIRKVGGSIISYMLTPLQKVSALLAKLPLVGDLFGNFADAAYQAKFRLDNPQNDDPDFSEPQVLNPEFKASSTPKPVSSSSYNYETGKVDLNFTNLPPGTDVKQTGNKDLANINIIPVVQP